MSFDKMSTDEKIKKPFMKPEITPQPHFIPGYTGFCPDLPRVVGASYARITHEILKDKPCMAGRLSSLDPYFATPAKRCERELESLERDKTLINSRVPTIGRRVLNDYMMPGYCGHVPNSSDAVGMSFSKGCIKSISKFIREQAGVEESRSEL